MENSKSFATLQWVNSGLPTWTSSHRKLISSYRKYWREFLAMMTSWSISGRAFAKCTDWTRSIYRFPTQSEPLVLVCRPVPRTNREFLFPIAEHFPIYWLSKRRYAPLARWWTLDTSSSLKIRSDVVHLTCTMSREYETGGWKLMDAPGNNWMFLSPCVLFFFLM